jgi:cyclic pyranopterin phosphate synthase
MTGVLLRGIYEIDEADVSLSLVPLAGRRALDRAGRKLPLAGWTSLAGSDRRKLIELGAADEIDVGAVREIVARSNVPAEEIDALSDPNPARAPQGVIAALGGRPLDDDLWQSLTPLDRYAFSKLVTRGKTETIPRLYDELARRPKRPTHLDSKGEARMVSVGEKAVTARRAIATATVRMEAATLAAITTGGVAKGDVFGTARIAGILAAKRTQELIPLCHSVALTRVDVIFEVGVSEVRIRALAEALDRTGVEMEAMVAASVAALTIYDMCKGIDRWMSVTAVELDEKEGGRSGRLVRPR